MTLLLLFAVFMAVFIWEYKRFPVGDRPDGKPTGSGFGLPRPSRPARRVKKPYDPNEEARRSGSLG